VLNQESMQANKVLQTLREKEAERSRQAEKAIEGESIVAYLQCWMDIQNSENLLIIYEPSGRTQR
jgi:hypothetical protein